ncbi:hypothetical protein [Rhodococcus sp. HNM0569]|uniref:DUF6928 family protein n=1 Tax=Rhodococcus sp. HNM0569 TaxID=2716340 RepID=UPI00146B5F38|nr:hypothetical protein [Rhodococcus sp. HNM0569]NLU82439.1 hypothetical protein [Rhodococcus sp. HNM0569]
MARAVSTVWFVHTADRAGALAAAPEPDDGVARGLAAALLGTLDLHDSGTASLPATAAGRAGSLFVGAYPGLTVVAAPELTVPSPAALPSRWLDWAPETLLVCSRPDDAWGGFAQWRGGRLIRSFAASPTSIEEDQGIPQLWERPFWAGEHPQRYPLEFLPHPSALPFHPQQFAEAANLAWLGFRYTGNRSADAVDPAWLSLRGFRPAEQPALPPARVPMPPPAPVQPDPAEKSGPPDQSGDPKDVERQPVSHDDPEPSGSGKPRLLSRVRGYFGLPA